MGQWVNGSGFGHSPVYPFPRLPLALLSLAGLLFLAVAGAGCGRESAAGPQEIVYWSGWSGHEFEVQRKLIDEFNREHTDLQVRILSQFGNSGYQKVRISFAGGATPDVMSTVWADELPSYAMRGVLTPLDDYLARAGRNVNREYTPGVARMLQVDGHVYGMAVTTNTNFIAYNRRIFREAGLDPNRPPRTIAELDHAAEACTRYDPQGNFLRYGIRPAGLNLWAYVFGGRWYDPDTGRITANDPHNVAALRWLASYGRRYDIRKMDVFQTTFGSNETASGPFFVGKVAMWSTGEWAQQFITRYAPNLDWGWFALPPPSPPHAGGPGGGRPNTTTAGGSVFVIPAACKHKEAAWEFLNWITSPHPVEVFCRGIGNVPPLVAVGNEPVFQKDPLFKFAIAIAQGQNSFGPPPLPMWPTFSREITRTEESAVLGGRDPQEALDDLQRRMEEELRLSLQDLGRTEMPGAKR